MTITIYGIKHCDSMKKARVWLDQRGIAYVFHDDRSSGLDADRLRHWCMRLGWQAILNCAGTTFRKLSEADRTGLDARRAIELMCAQPSMIRRPVLESGKKLRVGFKPECYAELLGTPR
jgi:arsenate reductase